MEADRRAVLWSAVAIACVRATISLLSGVTGRRAACARSQGGYVRRREWLGRWAFLRDHVWASRSGGGGPVILTGLVTRWHAFKSWDLARLRAGGRGVRVTVSRGVEESSVRAYSGRPVKLETTFESFISALESTPVQSANAICGYMKQFDLRRVQTLAQAIVPAAARAIFSPFDIQTYYLWVGARGAMTGLHNDDEENLLCVVRGSKRVWLFPPSAREALHPNSLYDSGTECCDADAADPDLKRTPRFSRAPPPIIADVKAGEALYIPRFWYHQVETTSDEVCVSVNIFWSSPWDAILYGIPRALLHALHAAGLYRYGWCVCHGRV